MATENKDSLLWPVILLILAIISVQGGAAIAKTLFDKIGPDATTALRLSISALLLLFFFKPWTINFRSKALKSLIFYGIALGSMNFLFYRALEHIPIGIAVAIEFTGPLSLALFYSRRPIDFIWIILVVIGLALILPIGDNRHSVNITGILYALSAGVFWALYIVFGRAAGKNFGTATVSAGTLIAAILFAPIGISKAGLNLWDAHILFAGLCVALFSSAIPYVLEMMAMTKMPTKTFGTLSSLEPAFGALSGMIFLGEHLSILQWAALCAIIGASMGAAITARGHKKPPKKMTTDQPIVL